MASPAEAAENRLNTYMTEARKHIAGMRQMERENGWASPEDSDPVMEMRTAKEAFKAGIATESWSSVAEGLVMLENALGRLPDSLT